MNPIRNSEFGEVQKNKITAENRFAYNESVFDLLCCFVFLSVAVKGDKCRDDACYLSEYSRGA